MVAKNTEGKEKNKISLGLIITKGDLKLTIFPDEVKEEIIDSPYYLLIFISREDVIKVSCFPTNTKLIKKILIKLEEFSPEIVKGISEVLSELNLSKDILHTTGICYELEKCFYETYLIGDTFESGHLNAELIKNKFLSIQKVNNITIEDIPLHSI
ncbi:MAG: hypothetical protein ACFFDX_03165 [Candidatus Odinarchaeota archaeon]